MDAAILTLACVAMLIFTPGHGSLCWYSHLVKCPYVAMHMCSCIPVLVLKHGHVYLCCCSLLVMYTILQFTICHISHCSYSHLFMYCHVGILTWTCAFVLIFTLGYVSISLLIFLLGQVSLCWYLHMFMNPCFDILHLVMCPHLDSHSCLCIPVLLFSFGHVYLCCTSSDCHV